MKEHVKTKNARGISSMKRYNNNNDSKLFDQQERRYQQFFSTSNQNRSPVGIRRSLSTTLTPTSTFPTATNEIDYQYIQNPNDQQPRTRSIIQSFQFFIRFVIYQFWKNRSERYEQRQMERNEIYGQNSTWKTRLTKLNEQRINLVTLANYTFSIVAPSFFFLFIGALTTSIGKFVV
jgi:hypothetical protein